MPACPFPQDRLEQMIEHATSPAWSKGDMGNSKEILRYIGERMSGMALQSPDTSEFRQTLAFYAGVIGKLSGVEDGRTAAAYHWFDSPQGNQVDIFLERLGYKG
jgi:hypothetical protein